MPLPRGRAGDDSDGGLAEWMNDYRRGTGPPTESGDSDSDGDQDFAGFTSKNMTKEERAKREKEL